MAKTADEIASYLQAQGFGTVAGSTGTGIYIGPMPPDPDKCLAVRVTGGPAPEYVQGGGIYNEPTRVQIAVRDASSSSGWDAAESAANSVARNLETVAHMRLPTTTGTLYGWVRPSGPVIPLELDTRERPVFVVNFEIDKEPST